MKNVLFISVTRFDFSEKNLSKHLEKKFVGLSKAINPYILAKGKGFPQKAWGAEFYLLKPNFLFWIKAPVIALWLCLTKKIDIIVAQSPLLEGFLSALMSKLLRKELIVEVHGDWVEGMLLSKKRRFKTLLRKIVPIFAKMSLKMADKIRTISSSTTEQAKKIALNKPYFTFPTFTDLDIFLKEKDISFENFILFVGQLEKVKGVEYLIEAFATISSKFPNFKLVIVGEGEELKNFQFSIFNFQLQDKVELKGRLPLEEVKNLMAKCYCLVLPSLSEGLGRVILEAMALSKPVIASNVGGIPDLVQDDQSGFLVKPANANDLGDKLKLLLSNEALARQMGQQGRLMVKEKFSTEQYIADYLKMFS